ncbi:unnamed protein product [Trichobilharzia regenti]|nr:unnamed protein product [Trichobilharzia regenti]
MYKPVQQTFAPSDFTGGIQYSSENSYLHGETAAQSQSQYPFKNLTRYTKNDIHQANCHVYRPNENFTSSPFNDPLHVIADSGIHSFQEPHKKQTFPSSRCDNLQTTPTPGSIMSTSSLSTETPTPTATPTPTPEQPSQSPHGCFTTIDNGDNYSLSQAPWYQALLPREIAFELLAREEVMVYYYYLSDTRSYLKGMTFRNTMLPSYLYTRIYIVVFLLNKKSNVLRGLFH